MMSADKWLAKELALSHKHEELILRREAILRGTERYYDAQAMRSASFISDLKKARERNLSLLEDINHVLEETRQDSRQPETARFNTLKNNYWSMVTNVFPVWFEEVENYGQGRRSRSPQNNGQGRRSKTPQQMGRRSPLSPRTSSPGLRAQSPGGTLRTHSPGGSLRTPSPGGTLRTHSPGGTLRTYSPSTIRSSKTGSILHSSRQ